MLFWYPFKFDLPLSRIPRATFFVSTLCILVFIAQTINEHYFEKGINQFCSTYQNKEFVDFLASFKDAGEYQEECFERIYSFHYSQTNDEVIRERVNGITWENMDDLSKERKKIYKIYRKAYDASFEYVPRNITSEFGYRSGSYNPIKSITSTLLHSDIWHIVGNLLFFIAFGAVVELVISNYLVYAIIFITSSLTISLIFSLVNIFSPYDWQLGLSGIVSVMMGMAVYIVPSGRIKCAYILGFYAGVVSVPLMWLFMWFFVWDTYYVWSFNDTGISNIAHVTGVVFGYLWARKFYNDDRDRLKIEMDKEYSKIRLSRIEKIGVLEGIRKRNL